MHVVGREDFQSSSIYRLGLLERRLIPPSGVGTRIEITVKHAGVTEGHASAPPTLAYLAIWQTPVSGA